MDSTTRCGGLSATELRRSLVERADRLVGEILWITEGGRCYVCNGPASDPAHLMGRRYMRLRFDASKRGNVHLLCRECHAKDHAGHLHPGYMRTFCDRNGVEAIADLHQRMTEIAPISTEWLEDIVSDLEKRKADPYVKTG